VCQYWVGGFLVPSKHEEVRQRAVICQDCWFWKEMSCALANPESDVCANRRPVHGRAARPEQPQQASLVPTAMGHGLNGPLMPAAATITPAAARHVVEPFRADAPEATFSLAQLRPEPVTASASADRSVQHVERTPGQPPSFREIRSGRAAAASRAPVAEVRIPVAELELQPQLAESQIVAPGMEQLVERVRRRTAARISRTPV